MTFVVDASVAIKWVADEAGSQHAVKLLLRPMIAPSLFQAEVGHVLTKRVRRSELTAEQARQGFAFVARQCTLVPIEKLGGRALNLSLELHHSVHDCYYLAVAEAAERPLVTADAAFVAKLRRAGRGEQVYLLGEEVPND
ncbi:MAG TPA: type II toxin-antitoxin system VapC family toxin [Allosphingosinicella sp.]